MALSEKEKERWRFIRSKIDELTGLDRAKVKKAVTDGKADLKKLIHEIGETASQAWDEILEVLSPAELLALYEAIKKKLFE